MAKKLDDLYKELVKDKNGDQPSRTYEFEFDLKGNFTHVSPEAAEFAGYTQDALETISVWDVISEKDHDLMLEKFAARKEGAPVEPYEVTLITRDGKPIRIRVETSAVLEKGKVVRVRGRFTPV
jgi:PAS domain S-box-containing protein